MQIKQFTRIRNMSIVITITCALIVMICYKVDTNRKDIAAICGYIYYANQCIVGDDTIGDLPDSCNMLLHNDSVYKSIPEHEVAIKFETVEEMEAFVDGYDYSELGKINPYINAYIKQSLWEYADWCIDEDSQDYWHMKYVASQKTGGYSYARQIKYKWYKLLYEKVPFIVIISALVFVFVNVLCILYGLSGVSSKRTTVKEMPKWHNDCADGEE